jgi:tetratricopeptide (TPR) repeat protein
MAFVRQHGNQVSIVHGRRDERGKVVQETLFTFYSRPELEAALGKPDGGDAHRFESLFQRQHPGVKVSWPKIRKELRAHAAHLPPEYPYADTRLCASFRDDLCTFARQLLLTDPQHLVANAKVISDHRAELEFLQELLTWRLKLSESPRENQFTADNGFLWRYAMRSPRVPVEVEERVAGWHERGELEKLKAVVPLFIDCFPDYADGWNYLGLVALEEERLPDAIAHFQKTIDVGRGLFPQKIAKSAYWQEHKTRPYMRGLMNLATALNRDGQHEAALELADRLERECGDETFTPSIRSSAFLNLGRFRQAAEVARAVQSILPEESFLVAFAMREMGDPDEALVALLYAVLNRPRAAGVLAGRVVPAATSLDHWLDERAGRRLSRDVRAYLKPRMAATRRWISGLLGDPRLPPLLDRMRDLEARWLARTEKTENSFALLNQMKSLEFARQTVNAWKGLGAVTSFAMQ